MANSQRSKTKHIAKYL